jgi:hypothetical protein
MKTVFADSHYWIAIVNPNDSWAEAAKKARSSLGEIFIIKYKQMLFDYKLTEEEYSLILSESKSPDPLRIAALNFYRDIAKGAIK